MNRPRRATEIPEEPRKDTFDPFAVALLVPAMLRGEPIVIRENSPQIGGSTIHRPHLGIIDRIVHEVNRPPGRLAVRATNEWLRRKSA